MASAEAGIVNLRGGQPFIVVHRRHRTRERKSPSRGASPEGLWGISERASVRLVFLFLGGFLLGCHVVFSSV